MSVAILLAAAIQTAGAAGALSETDEFRSRLVAEALAANPAVWAAREGLRAARTRPEQAAALPGPMLDAAWVNEGLRPSLGSREDSFLGVMVSQELPYPGKRDLRRRVASLEAELAAAEVARVELDVTAGVRRAYDALRAARASVELAREREAFWLAIAGTARDRLASGLGPQMDAVRAQVEAFRATEARYAAEWEAERQLAALNLWRSRDRDAPVDDGGKIAVSPIAADVETLIADIAALSPELRAAARRLERGGAAIDLARLERRPDFVVNGGYENRGGLDGMWRVGVGIRFPSSRARAREGVAEATALRAASTASAESLRQRLRAAALGRLARARVVERTLDLYDGGILPQHRLSVESALASYSAGSGSFVQTLEAVDAYFADRSARIALPLEHANLVTDLATAAIDAIAAANGPMDLKAAGTGGMER